MNMYGYVGGDATNLTDPTGLYADGIHHMTVHGVRGGTTDPCVGSDVCAIGTRREGFDWAEYFRGMDRGLNTMNEIRLAQWREPFWIGPSFPGNPGQTPRCNKPKPLGKAISDNSGINGEFSAGNQIDAAGSLGIGKAIGIGFELFADFGTARFQAGTQTGGGVIATQGFRAGIGVSIAGHTFGPRYERSRWADFISGIHDQDFQVT